MSESRSRDLLIGALLGACIGLAAAWIASDARREEQYLLEQGTEARIQPNARDWIKFGVAAVALLRQLSDILTPKKH